MEGEAREDGRGAYVSALQMEWGLEGGGCEGGGWHIEHQGGAG